MHNDFYPITFAALHCICSKSDWNNSWWFEKKNRSTRDDAIRETVKVNWSEN